MGQLLNENDVYALFARNGIARLHVADIEALPRVDAVEVSRLGKLGRLMMPYKGCPRGRMGARGIYGGEEIQTEPEVMELDAIEDIEGDRWVPVLAEDLNNLKARLNNAVEVVHGRWVEIPSLMDLPWKKYRCDHCGCPQDYKHNYCPNCGAKMDGKDESL